MFYPSFLAKFKTNRGRKLEILNFFSTIGVQSIRLGQLMQNGARKPILIDLIQANSFLPNRLTSLQGISRVCTQARFGAKTFVISLSVYQNQKLTVFVVYTDRTETAHACTKTRNFEPPSSLCSRTTSMFLKPRYHSNVVSLSCALSIVF